MNKIDSLKKKVLPINDIFQWIQTTLSKNSGILQYENKP